MINTLPGHQLPGLIFDKVRNLLSLCGKLLLIYQVYPTQGRHLQYQWANYQPDAVQPQLHHLPENNARFFPAPDPPTIGRYQDKYPAHGDTRAALPQARPFLTRSYAGCTEEPAHTTKQAFPHALSVPSPSKGIPRLDSLTGSQLAQATGVTPPSVLVAANANEVAMVDPVILDGLPDTPIEIKGKPRRGRGGKGGKGSRGGRGGDSESIQATKVLNIHLILKSSFADYHKPPLSCCLKKPATMRNTRSTARQQQ